MGSHFVVISWAAAIAIFFDYLVFAQYPFLEAVAGPFLDLESTFSLKSFFHSLGCSNINYEANQGLPWDYRFSFLLTGTLEALEKVSLCFFLGLNLRLEAPLLHARLRKSFLAGDRSFLCFSFGVSLEPSSFPIFSLGHSLKNLRTFMEGRSAFWSRLVLDSTSVFCKALGLPFTSYGQCSFFLGSAFLQRKDCAFVFHSVSFFMHQHSKIFTFSFNVVAPFLGRISAFELGALPGIHGSNFLTGPGARGTFLYLLGTDTSAAPAPGLGFTVYQGSFFEQSTFFNGVHMLLPVSLYVERVSSFLNMEGLLRRTSQALTPYRFVYRDWEILQALAYYKLAFFPNTFTLLGDFVFFKEFFSKLVDYACLFFFNITEHSFQELYGKKAVVIGDWELFFFSSGPLKIFDSVVARPFNHYYCSEQFSRHSKILSLCFTKAAMPGFFRELNEC